MSIASGLVDQVLALRGVPAYTLVGGLAFGEAAVFVGFVLPGETAVILGGVLANEHRVSLIAITATAVLAAIVGDSVGYEVGRHFGTRLIQRPLFDHRRDALERARAALRRNAGRAVFLARFTAFLRAVMPGLAGLSHVPYRRFLVFNAAGALVWGIGFTGLGYVGGASYRRLEHLVGRASWVLLGVGVVLVLYAAHRRRTRNPLH